MLPDRIVRDIAVERARQEARWGGPGLWGVGSCASPLLAAEVKVMVLAEECGEVARAVLERVASEDLRRELVQVAAVAVAWIEALDLPADTQRSLLDDERLAGENVETIRVQGEML